MSQRGKKIIYPETVIDFGTHKGLKAEECPASYLLWCDENIDWFSIESKFYAILEAEADTDKDQYYEENSNDTYGRLNRFNR